MNAFLTLLSHRKRVLRADLQPWSRLLGNKRNSSSKWGIFYPPFFLPSPPRCSVDVSQDVLTRVVVFSVFSFALRNAFCKKFLKHVQKELKSTPRGNILQIPLFWREVCCSLEFSVSRDWFVMYSLNCHFTSERQYKQIPHATESKVMLAWQTISVYVKFWSTDKMKISRLNLTELTAYSLEKGLRL